MTEENVNPEELNEEALSQEEPTQAELLQELADETQDIVEAILEDGSNPDAIYMIEHHISCTDFDLLEKAAVACFKKGYEVTDPEELELEDGSIILAFDVVIEMNLDEQAIFEDVEKLFVLTQSFGIDYDGWGTYPEQ
ncbi:ribonuclease E inhibitor RraB [Psychromonas sp. Urea-02u-13]|uniref:ribonuclease E inhibitor RraB n=1 Tax=Psychromonas sp. Urea-02u-13 TaxID=2058326 RepID=UPI000C334160|nr:ribonuclease E inhibitor RraB [Psychromonas sp. Urea-02u-13]PKG39008.1 ribonuclease E inhibitor RraB [Psychromonas sp. Urea-02u-13]